MSKFIKNYNAKIKAKLQGHEVELTIPVDLSLMRLATEQAVQNARNMKLTDVEILSLTERPPEYEQLEIDFGDDDEEESESFADDQQFDDCSSAYTPYTRHPTQSETQSEGYTSYTSQMKPKEDSLPPTYTPKVNNSYTPYKTRVVSIDSKYTKYDFK